MILIIDNYDSFTYNLVQALGAMGAELKVIRNDAANIRELKTMNPDGVLISPGPCTPAEAGISVEAIQAFTGVCPILGVCLGCQSIAVAFGGIVRRADRLMHGKTSMIRHDEKGLYAGLENPFEATRYHSLIVDADTLPEVLEPTSFTTDANELMGIRHRDEPVEGVQFHPESFLTREGNRLLENFLKQTR